MKALEGALTAHLQQEVTTLAQCVRLSRTDGVVMGFTTLDRDLVIAGVTYRADSALDPTAVQVTADLRADNLDLAGVLRDDSLSEADLLAGVYERALIDIFLVDYIHLPATVAAGTVVWLVTAVMRGVELRDGQFVAELAGLTDGLQRAALELYTPTCRAKQLGDSRCKVNIAPWTHALSVAAVLGERSFLHSGVVQADGYFRDGLLHWTSGSNTGRVVTVRRYAGGVMEILDDLPAPLAVGQAFRAVRGCDRQFATCRDIFSNSVNFRGEPPHLLPGTDRLVAPL
jgi:uncharacterized phage protein (TIGR02218 family)